MKVLIMIFAVIAFFSLFCFGESVLNVKVVTRPERYQVEEVERSIKFVEEAGGINAVKKNSYIQLGLMIIFALAALGCMFV